MVDLKKDVIEKFISDKQKNLSYLNEREIGLFTLMSSLAEIDIYFHKLFTPLIRNYMEYKKSLRGFGTLKYYHISPRIIMLYSQS